MSESTGTYSVFLFGSIVSLADTDAETLVADGLIGALPDRLAALVCDITSHLWCHWCQLKQVLSIDLSEVCGLLLGAAEWRNWQLESSASGLSRILSIMLLVIGCLRSLNW